MTNEYINKLWLLQNFPMDEDSEAAHIIGAAPTVEIDMDEYHRRGKILGRLRKALEDVMDYVV